MKVVGIIAEYNPLHQGHLYQIRQVKKRIQPDVLVVILTGYFSSRGLPSLLSLEDKTTLALQAGADLVTELPCVYGAQSADRFAKYALQSLKSAGVNILCFGSESNDLDYLRKAAARMDTAIKNPALSQIKNLAGHNIALQPNDILGAQYIKYCDLYKIKPVCLLRDQSFKSATQTRQDFFAGSAKEFLGSYFQKEENWNSYYPYLRLFLQMASPALLSSFFLVEEGIENRLIANAKKCASWDAFLQASISKTYTKARIQRTCLMIVLQIRKEQMEAFSSFYDVIVLGMNSTGQRHLRNLDSHRVCTRMKDLSAPLQEVMIKSRTLYYSVLNKPAPSWKVIRYDENEQTRQNENNKP